MVWIQLEQALKTGSFVLFTGLIFGCALETSAIGLPEAGDGAGDVQDDRPPPHRDASTEASTVDDSREQTTSPPKRDVRTVDAGLQSEPSMLGDAGSVADDAPELASDGGADASTQTQPQDAGAVLPPPFITDPWQAGPYMPVSSAADGGATVFCPTGGDSDARTHPILIWDNTAGISGPSGYQGMLEHLASHGFVVVAAQTPSVEGSEVIDALDWIEAENTRVGSAYFGRLDTSKIAAAGHGLGSIATFAAASDPRLSTTLHLSGATNKSIGTGHRPIEQLEHPAAFFCDTGGGNIFRSGDQESSCEADFDRARGPVFFATVGGSEQLNLPASVAGALVGWLRWQLMGDVAMKDLFVEPTCTLCSRANWSVQQHGLELLP
jgi:hypothetical protein